MCLRETIPSQQEIRPQVLGNGDSRLLPVLGNKHARDPDARLLHNREPHQIWNQQDIKIPQRLLIKDIS